MSGIWLAALMSRNPGKINRKKSWGLGRRGACSQHDCRKSSSGILGAKGKVLGFGAGMAKISWGER